MMVNATAPLREVRLRPVSSRAPVCGALSCGLGELDEASAPCFLRVMAAPSLVPSFSRLALAATSAAVNCASISSSDMPSSWQRLRYSAVTISAVTSAKTPGLSDTSATNAPSRRFDTM